VSCDKTERTKKNPTIQSSQSFEMTKVASVVLPLLLSIPFSVAQLNTLAQAAGKKYFGTATDNSELTNTSYVAQLGNTLDFHQLTPVRQDYICAFKFSALIIDFDRLIA
jgi:hypothetical protein